MTRKEFLTRNEVVALLMGDDNTQFNNFLADLCWAEVSGLAIHQAFAAQ